MDRHQVRFALLKTTLLFLLGTSWVFGSFIYATRPEQGTPTATALDTLIRLPASLPTALPTHVFAPTTKTLQPIEMNVVKLNCWDDMKDGVAKDTDARWIRLIGKACQSKTSSDHISVRNISNGYVATVFGAGQMTTDFIPLQMGRNDILIRFESTPGAASESRFTFVRQ